MSTDQTLAAFRDIARVLGVTSNQVYMWHLRRDRNGFPEAVLCRLVRPQGEKKGAPLFVLQEVLDWWASYVPSRGGAPLGNQHALKHGQYVGRRARREAAMA